MEQLELFPDLRPMSRERLEQEAKTHDTKEQEKCEKIETN
jgi:hypothetical protein